jgi:hypothetical protein
MYIRIQHPVHARLYKFSTIFSTVYLRETKLCTFLVLLLSGIIENQNSDFARNNINCALDLCIDEVLILIFDDPAEQEDWQRPVVADPVVVPSNPRGRAPRAPCMEKIYENLRKPALWRRAGAMLWFLPTGQVYSILKVYCSRLGT